MQQRLDVRVIDGMLPERSAERDELVAALRGTPAWMPSRLFYDPLGCALFGAICELPEYYLTRTERSIVEANLPAIAAAIGRGRQLVDLGAGDAMKAERLIPVLRPSRYLPVDIAREAVSAALRRLSTRFPGMPMTGVVTDFTRGLDLDAALGDGPVALFYPGSSIGNFTPDEAVDFLAQARAVCRDRSGSGLLVGVDLVKDPGRLQRAYDDALGVTAAFNRNALNHVNRVLGTDFDPACFLHRALWNAERSRIEMHLEAAAPQRVSIDSQLRRFDAGERIHTENSCKYTREGFVDLLERAGFVSARCWTDPASDFLLCWALA